MRSAQVGAALRHIRRLATARHDHDLPDHQLLEQFATHRDEAAFAALLRRHGPMVLGVCRSTLHNLHDAEDVFQAAFLVLARKAGSIHRREAVSSWLHRVAYHLAVKARANSARRRAFEKRAVTMPSADPVLDMSLRELRGVLNEELQQLPEGYRAPLVLCGLEEKSLEEAARLLGWTRWTVKGRLQRGRELLRARLRRRGLALSAGLFATVLSANSVSAQVPPSLAASTLKAASLLAAGKEPVAGVVSAQVAALVQGASQTMFTSKAKIATALVLAVTVAAAACGVVRHRAAAADPPAQGRADQPKAQPGPKTEATAEVRGRVLDPDGQPVAGARLYLAKAAPDGPAASPQATSGPDGRFRFAAPRSEPEKAPAQVMAVARGHGCDWVKVGPAGEELTLRLVQDVPIRGRILDPDGKPVAGAKLTITGVSTAQGHDLMIFLVTVGQGNYAQASPRGWVGPLPGQDAVVTTGADGRFQLAGAGRDRVVSFRLEGPAIATADLAVRARAGEKVGGVYGASFDYLAAASRPIRGVVRDKATGKALAGVAIGVSTFAHTGVSPTQAVTDREGRYELLGVAKSPRYYLQLRPADGLYFRRSAELKDTPGLGALTADIDMLQGLTVRGKVTDKATGKPIANARVDYHPLWINPFIPRKLAGIWDPHSETTTGPDGSYILTVFPGQGVIGVAGPRPETYMPACVTVKERKDFFKLPLYSDNNERYMMVGIGENVAGPPVVLSDYHAAVLLEPGEKDEALVRDVALEAPRELKGRVVGPDGRPVTGVWVKGLFRHNEETLKESEFTVRGINPKAHRPLVFHHKAKNLGFFLKELPGAASEPLTIKLQPCGSASGRWVDPDGQPVAGGRVHVSGSAMFGGGGSQEVTTDKDGRFRVAGLVPGQEYDIRKSALNFPALVTVKPGEHKDLGDVKLDAAP
jgi:RNA polymerase sigma factor (sigma-70 family)